MTAKQKYIDADILSRYEFYDYGHALEILHESFLQEWTEIQTALRQLRLTAADISQAGGNESPIPKKFDAVLYPCGWREIRISGDLIVKKYPRQAAQRRGRFASEPFETQTIKGYIDGKKYNTIYADPPWQFQNRTGKVAPEHKRLTRYETMTVEEIKALPVCELADDKAHLYLWIPNALLPEGLAVMDAWGFEYKGNVVWEKVRKDGQPDGRGVGFYFRNVTELLLFGIKKKSAPNRTLAPARSQVNLIRSQKREHSRKPDEIIPIIEACSLPNRIELFARGDRAGWDMWGNQANADYEPTWNTYKNHTVAGG